MTDLRSALDKYLSMRKGLGYKYEHQTRRLADFVAFMEKRKARGITTKLAMEWATLPPDRHASWALRLSDVRGFARHVANFDPRTEVSPVGMLPGWKRAKPYVYSDAEIDALLTAALALPPADGLRRWTYHTLFGLIAVTGMRISEAMGLERDDVDLDAGVLTVRLGCRTPIEIVGEDRFDRAVGARADVDGPERRGFEPIAPIVPGEPDDAETGPKALLGVRPLIEDEIAQPQSGGPDRGGVLANALDRPAGIAPMAGGHMLGDRGVLVIATHALVSGNPLAPVEDLDGAGREPHPTSTRAKRCGTL